MPTGSAPEPQRRGWRRLVPKDPWQIILGPVILAVIGAGLAVLTRPHEAKKVPSLQALPPVVVNHAEKVEAAIVTTGIDKGQVGSRQTDSSKPRIEIRLHNQGTSRAVLTSARFVVRRFSDFPVCGQGAGLFVSARYDAMLPDKAGAVVEVPIDQQLGPDEADRFAFRLSAQHYDPTYLGHYLFYELDVSVRHDNAPKPLDVGRVAIAIPGAPPTDTARFFVVSGQSTCSTTPPREQLAVTSFKGARSAELDDFTAALRAAAARD